VDPVDATEQILQHYESIRSEQEDFYKDLHQNPELSHQEHRTAANVTRSMGSYGFQTETGIGGTGVAAVLQNGDGPTVLLRADMDALPLQERTGADYASTLTAEDEGGDRVPVMHACGHDIHVACLLGASRLLAEHRDKWHGTLVALFQPAVMELNLRTYTDATRQRILDSVRRTVQAECAASCSPKEPEFEIFDSFPLTVNDEAPTRRVAEAFSTYFGDRAGSLELQTASEDFSDIPRAGNIPYTYWGIGGTDPETYRAAARAGRVQEDIPANHSPMFLPVLQPTLRTGTEALVTAALAWLGPANSQGSGGAG
jgi:metal-dependent amidase/aminoacylase/carboxypeptidase family protein